MDREQELRERIDKREKRLAEMRETIDWLSKASTAEIWREMDRRKNV
jgi:uncharacterized coiled-coil protein SlyX